MYVFILFHEAAAAAPTSVNLPLLELLIFRLHPSCSFWHRPQYLVTIHIYAGLKGRCGRFIQKPRHSLPLNTIFLKLSGKLINEIQPNLVQTSFIRSHLIRASIKVKRSKVKVMQHFCAFLSFRHHFLPFMKENVVLYQSDIPYVIPT